MFLGAQSERVKWHTQHVAHLMFLMSPFIWLWFGLFLFVLVSGRFVVFWFSPFCVFSCLFFGSDFVVHLSLDLLMWRPFYYCMRSPFVAAFLAGRPPM